VPERQILSHGLQALSRLLVVISMIWIIRQSMPMLGGRSPTFKWTTWNPCIYLLCLWLLIIIKNCVFRIDNSNTGFPDGTELLNFTSYGIYSKELLDINRKNSILDSQCLVLNTWKLMKSKTEFPCEFCWWWLEDEFYLNWKKNFLAQLSFWNFLSPWGERYSLSSPISVMEKLSK